MIPLENIKISLVDIITHGRSECIYSHCSILEETNLNEIAEFTYQNPDNGWRYLGYLNHEFYLNDKKELEAIGLDFPTDAVEFNSLFAEIRMREDLNYSSFKLKMEKLGIHWDKLIDDIDEYFGTSESGYYTIRTDENGYKAMLTLGVDNTNDEIYKIGFDFISSPGSS